MKKESKPVGELKGTEAFNLLTEKEKQQTLFYMGMKMASENADKHKQFNKWCQTIVSGIFSLAMILLLLTGALWLLRQILHMLGIIG